MSRYVVLRNYSLHLMLCCSYYYESSFEIELRCVNYLRKATTLHVHS